MRKKKTKSDWYGEFCRLQWDEPAQASVIIACVYLGLTAIVFGLTMVVILAMMGHQ